MFAPNLTARFPKLLLLLAILLLGALVRFWDVSILPNGLHWDEQDTGYQAYSLFKTGNDYFGNILPLFPHSFADYRTPVYIYSAVPIIAKLGLSAFSVRLVSIIWSLLGLILIYLLTKDWLAPLVLALSHWHLQYSRKAVETISLSTCFLLGLVCFNRGLRQPRWLVISALGFALAIAAYSPGKLFVPLFLLALVFIYRKSLLKISKSYLLASVISFSLIAAPVLIGSLFGPAGNRFRDVSVLADPIRRSFQINLQRQEAALSVGIPKKVGLSPRLFDKLLHNKPMDILVTVFSNYLQTFSPEFLFIKGDPEPRHSPSPNTIGQLHLIEIVPLLLGLYVLVTSRRQEHHLLGAWLLLAPIPSALTREGGVHAARLLILLPALVWLITLGIRFLIRKSLLLSGIYFLLFLGSTFYVYGYYFTHYRWESAQPYQWGFSDMIRLALVSSPDYDRVILDFNHDAPLMTYLFTTNFDPAAFQRLHPLQTVFPAPGLAGLEGYQFGNIFLLPSGSRSWIDIIASHLLPGRNLIITTADAITTPLSSLNRIDYPNSLPAFYTFGINNVK